MPSNGGTARWARTLLPILIAGALFALPAVSHAATLFVAPSSGQFGVGQVFNVVVRVNSAGAAVNASEGVLSFNPAQLQVQSITLTGSIFNLNVQEPEFSNTAGTVRWTGVILNPGYTGTSGNLITVRFKGLVQATTTVKYSSGAVLANDGFGTNVLTGMSGGIYTIGPTQIPTTPTPSAAPQPTNLGAPVVTSPTHPDSVLWYSNNDPLFKWQLPAGVDGVSYLVNDSPTANPGNASDGLVSEIAFKDVPEGATYFHVKFRKDGVWGPIAHYAFNVDTIQPDPFSALREDGQDTMNPRPLLSFRTTDSGSGILKYSMRVGDGEWFDVPEGTEIDPYAMPLQPPGNRTVQISAVDRAGNSALTTLVIGIVPITSPVIVEYPPTVKNGEKIPVSGTADPGVTVRVEAIRVSGKLGRLLYSDQIAGTFEVKSDSAGRWAGQFEGLATGEYRLQAVAIDARGALSNPSNSVFVKVGYGIFARVAAFFAGLFGGLGWFVWVLRGLLFLLLMMLVAAWAHCGDWRFWIIPADLPETERKEVSKLAELAADIDDELVILAKVGRQRPLYPEEKYLKSKLVQYRKTVKFLLRDPHSRLAKRK